jgi:hypothetical protein
MMVTDTQPREDEGIGEHEDESWLAASRPKGVRVRMPLASLCLAVVLVVGVWGGATLEANQNPAAAATPAFAAGGAGRGAGRGGAAVGGAGNVTGAAATGAAGGLTGTVASVHGTTIQLTTTSGATVAVTLLPSTEITRTAAAAPTDITAGETITVRGQTASDGTTTAQAVAIVPASTTGG